MQLTDSWAKLAVAYYSIGDQPALDGLLERHPAAAASIADLYAADQDWERAIAGYSKLITDQTADGNALAQRASAYVATERWDLATADWLRVARQQPDLAQSAYDRYIRAERWKDASRLGLVLIEQVPVDSLTWLRIAPVLVLAGDDGDYAAFCRRYVQRFAETQLSYDPERVVKACLLLPKVIDVAELPVGQFAKSLDEENGPEWYPAWAWGTRALLAYRSGDPDSALKFAARSEELKPLDFAHTLNLAVRAMAQHQLEHPEEARRALDEASQLINRLQSDDKVKGDHDLLIAQILFHEAEALINGQAKP
jgi:tetratricopeptide (TPR) repeat protein